MTSMTTERPPTPESDLEAKPDPARYEPVRDHVKTGYEPGIPTRWIEVVHPDGTRVRVRYER